MEHLRQQVGRLVEARIDAGMGAALRLADDDVVDADARGHLVGGPEEATSYIHCTAREPSWYLSSGTIDIGSPTPMRRSANAGM